MCYNVYSGNEQERGNKMNWVDISILKKVNENEYVNLTDYSFVNKNIKICFKSGIEGDFIIAMNVWQNDVITANVDVQEMLALADIHNDRFAKQVSTGLDKEEAETLLATILAKKIIDYPYGKIKDNGNGEIAFQRQKFQDGKRIYPTVLTKQFKTRECYTN